MEANLIGATGLVGHHIVLKLLDSAEFHKVNVFTRKPTGLSHPKLQEFVVDFDDSSWSAQITGDVLFSALGTTLKAAGSKESQYKVDHDYQYKVAMAAALNHVKTYVLVSSVNADSHSKFFYLKMKGELESKIKKLPFKSIYFLRPGPLRGLRSKRRMSEIIILKLLDLVPDFMITDSMRSVEASQVAARCIQMSLVSESGIHVIGPRDI